MTSVLPKIIAVSVLSASAFNLAQATELPFETAEARFQSVVREQIFDGVVEAIKQTTVSAQTSGRVLEVLYDVDDFVNKDDVVARLRDKDQRAGVEQAEAGLAEARARYTEADAEYDRIKGVFKKKLVSKAEFDRAKAAKGAALARLEAAQAKLDQASEQLKYTQIRAPYSGIVTKRHIEVGETVQPGQQVMSGVSLEKLRVKVAIPQRLIHAVRSLGKARAFVDEPSGGAIDATKLTFFPYADGRTNTFDVRVELPEGVTGLFPGMFVKVGFVTGEKRQLVVPMEAVAYRSEVTGVYVVRPDQTVAFRHIRQGRPTGAGEIEVLAGLESGERVALQPIQAGAYVKLQHTLGAIRE